MSQQSLPVPTADNITITVDANPKFGDSRAKLTLPVAYAVTAMYHFRVSDRQCTGTIENALDRRIKHADRQAPEEETITAVLYYHTDAWDTHLKKSLDSTFAQTEHQTAQLDALKQALDNRENWEEIQEA